MERRRALHAADEKRYGCSLDLLVEKFAKERHKSENQKLTGGEGMAKRLPDEVRLGCINHRVQEAEGMITFTETDPMYGCGTKIAFQRDCDGICWYMHFYTEQETKHVMMAHVLQAFEMVQQAYGKDFERVKR